MKSIKQIIKEVNGSMAIEGMSLNEEEKNRIENCLTGKTSFQEMKERIIKRHIVKV